MSAVSTPQHREVRPAADLFAVMLGVIWTIVVLNLVPDLLHGGGLKQPSQGIGLWLGTLVTILGGGWIGWVVYRLSVDDYEREGELLLGSVLHTLALAGGLLWIFVTIVPNAIGGLPSPLIVMLLWPSTYAVSILLQILSLALISHGLMRRVHLDARVEIRGDQPDDGHEDQDRLD